MQLQGNLKSKQQTLAIGIMDDNFIHTNDTNEPLDDYETLRLLFNSILGPTVSILGIIGK